MMTDNTVRQSTTGLMQRKRSAFGYNDLVVIAVIAALKLLFVLLDEKVRFILGDSAVYLNSAFAGLPADRSWTYGALFVRALLSIGSVQTVVYAQAAISGLACYVLYRILHKQLGLGVRLSSVFSILACLDPLSLVYERFLLTDSLAWSLMTILICLALSMVRRPKENGLVRAISFAILSIAIASLRSAYIPVLGFLIAFIACFLIYKCRVARQYVFLSGLFVALLSFNAAYLSESKRLVGHASYNSSSGLFLLAAWAPNIKKVDLEQHAGASTVLEGLGFILEDPRNRPMHLFLADGLINRLRRHLGDASLTNSVARNAALHSLERNPCGIVALAWKTYAGYWDTDYMRGRIQYETGTLPMDANLVQLVRERYHQSLGENHLQDSLFRSVLLHATVWVAVLPVITMILALIALCCRTVGSTMIASVSVVILLTALGLATEPVPRYLIGLPWLNLLLAGMIIVTIRPAPVESGNS